MSGVVLAVAVFVAAFFLHVITSHVVRIQRKEPTLVAFMVAGIVAYPVVYAIASARLGFPAVVPTSVDVLAGFAALGFLVLGYVEFWSLIERSFSLRILIDVAGAAGGLTRDELIKEYSEGRGLDWMMEKRIEDLAGAGMVRIEPRQVALTSRGRLVASVFTVLQRIFGIA